MIFLKEKRTGIISGLIIFVVLAAAIILTKGFFFSPAVDENSLAAKEDRAVAEVLPSDSKEEFAMTAKQQRESLNLKKKDTVVPEKKALKEAECEDKAEAAKQDEQPAVNGLTCTLSVKCDNVFDAMTDIKPEKAELIPAAGVIFPETEVVFYEGESVFNVMMREMKKNKIHIDFNNTPMYNTAYIKGIANLYENDCGELSGWIYKVNNEVPPYGCSQYLLKPGDKVEWIYTCNSGGV